MTHLAQQFQTNVSTEREALPSQIPRKLLFTYKTNLFKAEQGHLSTQEKILLANMKRTVRVFQNMTGGAPDVEMWDDQDCFTALEKLQMKEGPELALDFRREAVGMIKSDICRLVMLYNTGGYYFDIDVAPLDALHKALDPRATFVTTKIKDGLFFQAFLATTPKHPVIRKSLTMFKTWYDEYSAPGQNKEKLRQETGGGNIGTALLARSFKEWSSSTSESPLLVHHAGKGGHVSQFFQEWQFEMQGQGVAPRERRHFSYDDYCDWGAVDTRTNTVVLIARVYDWRSNKICEA